MENYKPANRIIEPTGNEDATQEIGNLMKSIMEKQKLNPHAGVNAQNNTQGRLDDIKQLIHAANLPKRHSGLASVIPVKEWKIEFDHVSGMIGTGFTSALIGSRGTGKTQIAVECIKAVCLKVKPARYCSAIEFFMDLKASYRKDAKECEADVMMKFRKPKLLVIDEITKRSDSAWENSLLFELIDKRYGDQTDTILIGNCTPQELNDVIGPSLMSRINETGGIIVCNWKSFRQ